MHDFLKAGFSRVRLNLQLSFCDVSNQPAVFFFVRFIARIPDVEHDFFLVLEMLHGLGSNAIQCGNQVDGFRVIKVLPGQIIQGMKRAGSGNPVPFQ